MSQLLEAIEKAMEGVTPGPWYPGHLGTDSTCQCRSIVDEGIYMGAIATVHVDNGLPIGEGGNDAPPAEEAAANMRYIAACNPAAIREVLAAASEAEALKREIAELRDSLSDVLELAERQWANPEELSEIRRARALLSKESADAAGSATSSSGTGGGE